MHSPCKAQSEMSAQGELSCKLSREDLTNLLAMAVANAVKDSSPGPLNRFLGGSSAKSSSQKSQSHPLENATLPGQDSPREELNS